MNSEAKKDELRMSWNKKVSMREIAQFYEDKLRELDAKQTKLMEDVNRKEAELESKMHILENSIDGIKDFLQDAKTIKGSMEQIIIDFKKMIASGELENQMRTLRAQWKIINEKVEEHDAKLEELHLDLVNAIASITSISVWLKLLQINAVATTLLVDEHILDIQAQFLDDPEALERLYLRGARRYVRNILKIFASFNDENRLNDIIDEIAKESVQRFLREIKEIRAKHSPAWEQMEGGGTDND